MKKSESFDDELEKPSGSKQGTPGDETKTGGDDQQELEEEEEEKGLLHFRAIYLHIYSTLVTFQYNLFAYISHSGKYLNTVLYANLSDSGKYLNTILFAYIYMTGKHLKAIHLPLYPTLVNI